MGHFVLDFSALLTRRVGPLLGTSREYANYAQIEDWIPAAIDQIILSCRSRVDFEKLGDMSDVLLRFLRADAEGDEAERGRAAETWLETYSERWLKAVWWIVDPKSYGQTSLEAVTQKNQQRPVRFNLFEAMVRLDLLTKAEANCSGDNLDSISDPVRRTLQQARLARNQIHDGSRAVSRDLHNLVFVMLCAPIVKHSESLRKNLGGLICSQLGLTSERLQLIRSVAEARQSHLRRFAGREQWLEQLQWRLASSRTNGGYVLLTGPEGQGKSALLSKLSESLAIGTETLGVDGPRVQREAPWLPNVIFHLGKQSRNPRDVVRLLVAQANTLLLRPIEIHESAGLSSYEGESNLVPLSRLQQGTAIPSTSRALEDFTHLQRAAQQHAVDNLDSDRNLLFAVCQRLVEERGAACFIIDALDEISRSGDDLRFLPDPVPRGAVFVLSVKSNLGIETWIQTNRSGVDSIALDNVSRTEVPLITGVVDSDDGGREFNDRVFERTKGWAYLVSAVGKQLERANGRFDDVELDDIAQALLERQASEWIDGFGEPKVLRSLLPVLAVLEPCTPISADSLQAYLKHCGISLRRPDVVAAMRRVGHHLEGLASNRIKLAQAVFADYVRETYLSVLDHSEVVEQILEWFGKDQHIERDLVTSVLGYSPRHGDRKLPEDSAERVLASLRTAGNVDAIYRIGLRFLGLERFDLAHRFLSTASDLNHAFAQFALGTELVQGDTFPRDIERGLLLLRKAASSGVAGARTVLSLQLFSQQAELDEARRLLRTAAEDNYMPAMFFLGMRLLDGFGFERDESEGESWLRKAADAGFNSGPFDARLELAQRLIDGRGLPLNREEGIRILRAESAGKNVEAMLALSFELAEDAQAATEDEAIALLERASALGHESSTLALAQRLTYGYGARRDSERAEKIFRRLIQQGNIRAAALLGDAILDGEVPGNLGEAVKLLEDASAREDTVATTELGNRLLTGDGVPEDKNRGLALLTKAAERGHGRAMVLAAGFLFSVGRGAEAQDWLERGSRGGYLPAQAELGKRLVLGNGVHNDEARGFSLLRLAAERRDSEALSSLIELAPTARDAEKFLAAIRDYPKAADSQIGFRHYTEGNVQEAAAAFRRAHRNGVLNGSNNLAYLLRRGEVQPIEDDGSIPDLLAKGLEANHPFSMINYSLWLVMRSDLQDSWKMATEVLDKLPIDDQDDVVDWWNSLAEKGECEGLIVMHWIARLNNDNEASEMWLRRARAQGCLETLSL